MADNSLAISFRVGTDGLVEGLMTQLHSGEMVLPEKHADVIRGLADGDGGGGAGGPLTVHLHGVTDSDSFRRFWNNPNNVREFRDAVRRGRM